MRDDENYNDLTRLFAAEDDALDAAAFSAGVMKRVRRAAMVRRLTVGGLGFLGAVIAIFQLPDLLSAFVGVDESLTQALSLAQAEVSAIATGNPLWLAIATCAALTLAALTAMERA